MSHTVEFWFDLISPYAYLAWTQIPHFRQRHDCQFVYRPVLFAGLLEHWGQLGPVEIEPKRRHAHRQVIRRARGLGVDLQVPVAHPFNSILGLRLVVAAPNDAMQERVIDALFRGVWAGGRGIWEPDLAGLALREAGIDADLVLARAQENDVKDRLRANGSEAITHGIFGVPTFKVGDEIFWGLDDLPDLARYLDGTDFLHDSDREAIANLPAQAKRRGASRT